MSLASSRPAMSVTKRDAVWAAALELAAEGSSWRGVRIDDVLDELGDDAPSRKTVERVLRAMSETGYLKHRRGSPRYRRGDRLRELQDSVDAVT